MSYSISGSGHISSTPSQTAAEVEAELLAALRAAVAPVLADPKYGVSVLKLYGQHTGTTDLASAPAEPAAPEAEPLAEADAGPF
jgi:hypothetical protein